MGAQSGILEVNVCGCWLGGSDHARGDSTDDGPDLEMREIFLFIN